MKKCKRCTKAKPLAKFLTEAGRECKHCDACREDGRRRFKKSYKKNPKAVMRRIAAYRATLNPEIPKGWSRESMRLWRQRYPDRVAKKNAAYSSRHKGKMLAHRRARTLRQAQAMPKWANVRKIERIYILAARLRAEGQDVHVEHVLPLRGRAVCGLHVHTNLKIRSAAFNMKKSNKVLPDRN